MPDPASWQGRRVWLTGHTGFKGAWLALWLQSLGAEVYGFSAGPVSEPSLYELAGVADGMAGDVRGDVRSKGEVRAAIARARPEVVFHLAAQALVRRGLAKPVETFTVNVTGTAKVLEALRAEASPAAVVVVTSDKCYRNDGGGRAFREDDPLGGDDPYSASKAAQEHTARGLPDDGPAARHRARRQRDRRRRLGGRPARRRLHARGARRRARDAPRAGRRAALAARALPARGLPRRRRAAGRRRRRGGDGVELRPGRGGRAAGQLAGRAHRRALARRAGGARRGRRRGRGAAPAPRRDAGARAAGLGPALGSRGRPRRYGVLVRRATAMAPTCAPRRSGRSRTSNEEDHEHRHRRPGLRRAPAGRRVRRDGRGRDRRRRRRREDRRAARRPLAHRGHPVRAARRRRSTGWSSRRAPSTCTRPRRSSSASPRRSTATASPTSARSSGPPRRSPA